MISPGTVKKKEKNPGQGTSISAQVWTLPTFPDFISWATQVKQDSDEAIGPKKRPKKIAKSRE